MAQNVPIMDYVAKLENMVRELKAENKKWMIYSMKAAMVGMLQPYLAFVLGLLSGMVISSGVVWIYIRYFYNPILFIH